MGKKISRRLKLKKISYAEPPVEKTSHILANNRLNVIFLIGIKYII
jgi:hypothetical protein